jgi:hypothetical protein
MIAFEALKELFRGAATQYRNWRHLSSGGSAKYTASSGTRLGAMGMASSLLEEKDYQRYCEEERYDPGEQYYTKVNHAGGAGAKHQSNNKAYHHPSTEQVASNASYYFRRSKERKAKQHRPKKSGMSAKVALALIDWDGNF